MPPTDTDLLDRLRTVEDPENGDDVVSLGLVNGVTVEDGTATVSLAFNTPYAPAEMAIGDAIRDALEAIGLEPDLRAHAGAEQGFDQTVMPLVRNVVAVASGKGGVGKTTVAANIAAAMQDRGARVGVLDADVHGPNVPRILPVEDEPGVTPDGELVPPRSDGVMVMSMASLTANADDPAILRGPMVNNVMMEFIENVEWGRLDYLFVDLPPGTGDASLNLLQTLPVAGVVIVTTPQEMAVQDARKGLRLFEKHDTPVLGVVENMSSFRCPSCEDDHRLFGTGAAQTICEDFDAPLLARLPVHPDFDSEGGRGPTVRDDDSAVQADLREMADAVADRLGAVNRRRVADDGVPDLDAGVPSASDGEPAAPATGADEPDA